MTELEREPRGTSGAAAGQPGFSVCMEDVSFSYGGEPVVRHADFAARPGEIVALVGPSGGGKTTMLRLMLGLVRPSYGRVYLRSADGVESAAGMDVRHLIAYVPQGNTVLSGTIADNLRLVRPQATEEELEQALRLACAWDFVSRLPEGLHASVGERGRGLSEGQAQRLAIARAILKDAPVLLLDEATSALDVATERQVLRNIVDGCPPSDLHHHHAPSHRPGALRTGVSGAGRRSAGAHTGGIRLHGHGVLAAGHIWKKKSKNEKIIQFHLVLQLPRRNRYGIISSDLCGCVLISTQPCPPCWEAVFPGLQNV